MSALYKFVIPIPPGRGRDPTHLRGSHKVGGVFRRASARSLCPSRTGIVSAARDDTRGERR